MFGTIDYDWRYNTITLTLSVPGGAICYTNISCESKKNARLRNRRGLFYFVIKLKCPPALRPVGILFFRESVVNRRELDRSKEYRCSMPEVYRESRRGRFDTLGANSPGR